MCKHHFYCCSWFTTLAEGSDPLLWVNLSGPEVVNGAGKRVLIDRPTLLVSAGLGLSKLQGRKK